MVAGSMIVSIGAYALLGGWWFGVGLVALIFVHEMANAPARRRQGVPASALLFIPFMGAVIGMKKMPENAWREAEVALAGPLLGSVGVAAVWLAGSDSHSQFLVGLAFVGFFINLFNLIPVVPLDGGRAVAVLSTPQSGWSGWSGSSCSRFCGRARSCRSSSCIASLELWGGAGGRAGSPASPATTGSPAEAGAAVATAYIGLAVLLVLAMNATHSPNTSF